MHAQKLAVDIDKLQHKYRAPFVLCTFCCMWKEEMKTWLQEEFNNFVAVKDNKMSLGILRDYE